MARWFLVNTVGCLSVEFVGQVDSTDVVNLGWIGTRANVVVRNCDTDLLVAELELFGCGFKRVVSPRCNCTYGRC